MPNKSLRNWVFVVRTVLKMGAMADLAFTQKSIENQS